jgi:DNA mismatch repair protein MutL
VIERPASVVKELVENSIDAGSSDIKIEVSYGGKRLIRVSDDGCGMDSEDAVLCFQRHATSKLEGEEALFHIRTLGFRGEALPSIASVSRVKLVTGVRGTPSGISMELEGGTVKETRDSAFSGTLVEISDIFFNTPARKKFLKTNSTELSHIIDMVTKEAIAHFEISFSLFTESRETMLIPRASGFRERIMQIFGAEFLEGLTEVHAAQGSMKMDAFLSDSTAFRKSRSHQYVFVNRRPVKDQTVSAALYRAFEGILPGDRHPAFFIFLEIDPGEVDFNVHPAKREVRFQDKEGVYRFVHGHVREAVKAKRTEYTASFADTAERPVSFSPSPGRRPDQHLPPQDLFVSENISAQYRPAQPSLYLGETFVALSGKGGMTILDHHAAHERVLYEKFLKKVDLGVHLLLFPLQVRLSAGEYRVLLENRDLLLDFGIEIDDFGSGTVVVRALPTALEGADIRGILADTAAAITEGVAPGRSLKESLAARIACHGSVRGSEILNQEELSRLLADLEETDFPDQCPHGRPTRIFFSFDDLKRLFKRK